MKAFSVKTARRRFPSMNMEAAGITAIIVCIPVMWMRIPEIGLLPAERL